MKKSLSFVLSLLMIITTLCAVPFTAHALTDGDWEYSKTVSGAIIEKYNGNRANVEIPSTLGGENVVVINDNAFSDNVDIDTVIMPNTVTRIGDYAFDYSNLSSITLSTSLTYIGKYAFNHCPLESIELPNSLLTIDKGAFDGCSSLATITIPKNVSTIGDFAFQNCYDLTAVNVDGENSNYASEDGVLLNKNKTELLFYPVGKTATSYTVPFGTTAIGDYAFYSCTALTSVDLGSYMERIGEGAFSYCENLADIEIPRSVTFIGENAFAETAEEFTIIGYCNNEAIKETVANNPSFIWEQEHTEVEGEEVASTCTEAGHTAPIYCKYCNKVITPSEVLTPDGHHFKTKVVAPTCTERGYTKHTCTVCNYTYNTNYKDKNGHKSDGGTVTKQPTYTEEGVKTYKCTVCGKVIKTAAIAKKAERKNTLTVTGKTVILKHKSLKKKSLKVNLEDAMIIKKAKGNVKFTLSSAKKGDKNFKKYFSINKSSGKITVKKGLKKGTYKVKINVTAAGTTSYKKGSKTVTVTIKVK